MECLPALDTVLSAQTALGNGETMCCRSRTRRAYLLNGVVCSAISGPFLSLASSVDRPFI